MSPEWSDKLNRAEADPLAKIERALIEEFLRAKGCSLETLHNLPAEKANALLKEASLYASGRLTEVESRAHFVHDIHGEDQPSPGQRRARKA